jgi:hypothetical protein
MRRASFIIIVLISSLLCGCSKNNDVGLSTPGKTLKSYYEAFKKSDFEYQKRTLQSSIQLIGKERFDLINPILQSYQIFEIREAKDRKEDTYHLPEGDVDAMVKEIYKDKNENMVSFVLRKFNNEWLIIDILTLEKSDLLEGNKAIKK